MPQARGSSEARAGRLWGWGPTAIKEEMAHSSADAATLEPRLSAAFTELAGDLRRAVGERLTSLVAYGDLSGTGDDGAHALALVDRLSFADLARCVSHAPRWRRLGLATPLLLAPEEFRRSLDVFPIEYGEILARHIVVAGSDPFAGITVNEGDLRRACERQAKSHLIHLREGFLETGSHAAAVARLIAASAPAFRALLLSLERLEPGAARDAGVAADLPREVAAAADATIADPSALLARYIAAVERLWQYVDRWR